MTECFIETNKFNYINNIYFLCVFLFISNCSRVGIFHKIPSLLRINLAHSLVIICLPINVFNQSIILCCLYAYSFRIYCDIILYKINAIIIKAFSTTYCIASLLLFLIILANVSILNPGPEKIDALNCYFQNVQGFVTLNSISKPFPDLCITKILEFQIYVFDKTPIVGDMNLDTVNWLSNSTSNRVHTSFINLFDDLGLSQLIHEATHKGGKILDVLLCDSPDIIRNLKVENPGTFVSSDHSPITFSINAFVRKVKAAKRSIYNFKKANWVQLNNELCRVDWLHLLGSNEVEMGWNIFKNKFLAICDKHIPKIKISESFHPPWFDSDVFRLNKKKELYYYINLL